MIQKQHAFYPPQGLLIALFCFALSTCVFGQYAEYRNYGVKDGLPSSEVYNAMQDSKGFMWFATDKGVCRFDGYQFKTFNTNDGLADNTVFECQEDYKGRIWFKSLSGKLSYYYHDSIYRLPVNDSLSNFIKALMTVSISVDTSDNIYLSFPGSMRGIIKINLHNPISFILIPIPVNIFYIVMPRGGPPLIGNTFSGSTPHDSSDDRTLILYTITPNAPYLKKANTKTLKAPQKIEVHDRAILLKNGKIAASFNTTLAFIDTSLSTISLFRNLNNEYLLNINIDNEQNLWLSGEKMPRYFKDGVFTDRHLPRVIGSKCVTSVIEDKEGGTWFTTLNGGIYYINSMSFKTYNSTNGLPGDKIKMLSVSNDGTIWTSSEQSNQLVTIHQNDSIVYHRIPQMDGSSINNILLTKDNTVWVGSTGGLNVYKNDKHFALVVNTQALAKIA